MLNGPELTGTARNCTVATRVESVCPGQRTWPGLTGRYKVVYTC